MKPAALPFVFALAAFGLVGMMRGSAYTDVSGDHGAVYGPSALADKGNHSRNVTERTSAQSPATLPDWTPTPEPGRVLAPGETVRVLPYEVWRASLVMSDENRLALLRITACETGGTWDTTLRGAAGEEGVAQVIARYWGAVPADLRGQMEQADGIYTEHGDWPWSTRAGCPIWSAE